MINAERKGFGLRGMTRKPSKPNATLSQAVLVREAQSVGLCYIAFAESFIDFVGRAMPRGVAPHDPCFLEVVKIAEAWRIDCVYYRDGARCSLWVAKERPSWIGTPRRITHASNKKSTDSASGVSARPAQGATHEAR